MPDLDIHTGTGPLRVCELLHDARPLLLNLDEPGALDIEPWADRVQLIDASHEGEWELPVLGVVTAPDAVLVRPDGYVAWVGDGTQEGLSDALSTWFGVPSAPRRPAPQRPGFRRQAVGMSTAMQHAVGNGR
jgi:3-(3-hydroxy-phenyl)propionate hydroxylase